MRDAKPNRRKTLIIILTAASFLLVALLMFSNRPVSLRRGELMLPQRPTDRVGGSIGVRGAGPISSGPTYSPDGRNVAFSTDWGGGPHIWIVGTDGSNLRQLTTNMTQGPGGPSESREFEPSWSPDGSRIAFASDATGVFNIWVIGPDGLNLTRLTSGPDDRTPIWSPSGFQIVFTSERSGSGAIWIVNGDGTNLRTVSSLGTENNPSFSPDGLQLVFSSSQDSGGSNLFVINTDGTGLRRLTTGNFNDFHPSWSARGIVFDSNRTGTIALWLIQPDGSGLQALPGATGADPVVSPDGTKAAFTGDGIFEFNFADSTVRQVVKVTGYSITLGTIGYGTDANGNNIILVPLLSSPDFDPVNSIAQSSISFGPTGDERSLAVNPDGTYACSPDYTRATGVPDLKCAFNQTIAMFTVGVSQQAILRTLDINGIRYEGRTTVTPPGRTCPRWAACGAAP